MTDNEYSKTRKAAADAIIHWAKTGWGYYDMRDAVNVTIHFRPSFL